MTAHLPPEITEAINEGRAQAATLAAVGGQMDEFGQTVFTDVHVIFYPVGGEYEVDIVTPTGAIGFDVPIRKVGVKVNTEETSGDR